MPDIPWWKEAVVYQIYPRSFADTDGDGVGDLPGIRAHLDHLEWLGVDALWLSPFYRSPMADFGYDIADYCDVDPLFGDIDDIDALVADAHARGIRVVIDFVGNHTSDQHPWFVESRSSRDNPKRDWYVWRDSKPDGSRPNNWIAAFPDNTPAWTFDEVTGQWYLHLFLSEQPDLNWDNPDVVEAMHDVLRFWMDRGVDGFRCDVVHLVGKDPELADLPEDLVGLPPILLIDHPSGHERMRGMREVVDSYAGDRFLIGEITLMPDKVATFYGDDNDELHLAFNFIPMLSRWDARSWKRNLEHTAEYFDALDHWPTWVLSNHDQPRHATRYGGSAAVARSAAVLLLTLRGTPFLYMGEELGLEDAEVPDDRVVDPGGRDGCRAPIPWTRDPSHGWPAEPWLPWPPHATDRSVEALRDDPTSILHLYRRLLAARTASPALHRGTQEPFELPEGVLGWRRFDEDSGDERIVLVNFTADAVHLSEGVPTGIVELSSVGAGEGEPLGHELRPHEAVVVRP